MRVEIDDISCYNFAKIIREKIIPNFIFDSFDDPLLFPPAGADDKTVANYFFFMTAIDHRTHLPNRKFESYINKKLLTGSDLLFALAKKKELRSPGYFTAENLLDIDVEEIKSWLTIPSSRASNRNQIKRRLSTITIRNPSSRSRLLRDCAKKLIQKYDGQPINIIYQADGSLIKNNGCGFLQLLSHFKAYSGPLHKKSFLITKVFERRNILVIKDEENLNVPVDNLLVRIALRCGLIEVVDPDLAFRLRRFLKVNQDEEFAIREATMRAYRIVSAKSNLRATYLDDILWTHGQKYCHRKLPACGKPGGCIFTASCKATNDASYISYLEPNFRTIFY